MSWAELMAAAEAIRDAAAATGEARLNELRIVGIGWATVEADRAFEELGSLLNGEAVWLTQQRDSLLGVSAWRRDPPPGEVALFVLEPDTEGRLAAFLARFGEGVGAVYLASSGSATDQLVPVNPRWGPYVIVRGGAG